MKNSKVKATQKRRLRERCLELTIEYAKKNHLDASEVVLFAQVMAYYVRTGKDYYANTANRVDSPSVQH
jgi:hypothetical protein